MIVNILYDVLIVDGVIRDCVYIVFHNHIKKTFAFLARIVSLFFVAYSFILSR